MTGVSEVLVIPKFHDQKTFSLEFGVSIVAILCWRRSTIESKRTVFGPHPNPVAARLRNGHFGLGIFDWNPESVGEQIGRTHEIRATARQPLGPS